jgi:hypothetical protein
MDPFQLTQDCVHQRRWLLPTDGKVSDEEKKFIKNIFFGRKSKKFLNFNFCFFFFLSFHVEM